jgi:cytoplasmic iron level regulating protein YaaA (DUF328/UPF0246 family)
MKIIISPAKKMKTDRDSLPWKALPVFIKHAEKISVELRKLSAEELKRLWKCNDSILQQNAERLQNLDLYSRLTPAILAYEGIQYRYMSPNVFTDREYEYIQEKMRILSGFYGVLKPFDGVTPYRLEMQAKLRMGDRKDMYSFWGNVIAEELLSETDCVINLASKEYSVCISKYLRSKDRFITCVFGELKEGKVIEKGTLCKMARGEMVRYMAEHQIEQVTRIKEFDRLNYRFSEKYSDDSTYVFLQQEDGGME